MNPRACHETKMPILPAVQKKNLAVVGAGPAGLAFAINAAARGHQVTLFDAHSEIGGQFNIAKQIPGKEEFYETLRYYHRMIEVTGVTLKLNHTVTADQLQAFDETILASGIMPARSAYRRDRSSEGIELSRCTARQSAGRQQGCHHRLWRDWF